MQRANTMIRLYRFLPLLITGFFLFPGHETYSQNKSTEGLNFKILSSVPNAPKPVNGDVVDLVMVYKNAKDSVLFDNRKGEYSFIYTLVSPVFKNDFNTALSKLGVGDSAAFVINADSFYLKTIGQQNVPPYVARNSYLTFNVKMISLTPHQEYLKKQFAQAKEIRDKNDHLLKREKDSLRYFLERNNITVSPTASGLYYLPQREGNGQAPVKGNSVRVNYQAYFLSGKKFDSSDNTGIPLEFVIGGHTTMIGLEEGILLMKKGGKARLIIPSFLGFGENSAGDIPPFTTLVYDVELIEIQ